MHVNVYVHNFYYQLSSIFLVVTKAKQKSKKEVYTESVAKAFKPMIDILESLLKGMLPFIVMLTAFAIVVQLLKAFQNFQRGDTYQRQLYTIVGIVFSATLIMTYSSWLTPILKKVAGI